MRTGITSLTGRSKNCLKFDQPLLCWFLCQLLSKVNAVKPNLRSLISVILLIIPSLAIAQPKVDLIWSNTTGTGDLGSSTITAEKGDELALDIYISGDKEGIYLASVSLYWDAGIVTGFNAQECPSPPHIGFGLCNNTPSGFVFSILDPGVEESAGSAEGFDIISSSGTTFGLFSEKMVLGRLEFIVELQETTDIVVGYRSGPDGILDGDLEGWLPEAKATILPPCSGCGCPP